MVGLMVGFFVRAYTLYTIEYYKEILHPMSVGASVHLEMGRLPIVYSQKGEIIIMYFIWNYTVCINLDYYMEVVYIISVRDCW